MTLAIDLLILFWLLASALGMRRLLRWWFQRQIAQLDREAERIREGLLQELFAIRRSLELTLLSDQPQIEEMPQWSTQLEAIQQSLEAVANRLSPPYVGDSLPLAIQYHLKDWQVEHSLVNLEMDLPTDWNEEPIEPCRVILTVLDEWLCLVLSQPRSDALLHISLKQHAGLGQLCIQLTAPNVSELLSSHAVELTNLQQFFQVLAKGKCYCRKQGSTVAWYYQWRSPC